MRAARALLWASAGAVAYAAWERQSYRLARRRLEMAPNRIPVTILHISDLHMRASDRKLQSFLRRVPEQLGEIPDFVMATGDLLEDESGVDPVIECLAGLEARLGRYYVLGSHDYYVASFNPFKYLSSSELPARARRLPTHLLDEGLTAKGWVALNNDTATVDTGRGLVRIAGIDDPYLHRHRTHHLATSAADGLTVGLMHAPDVVSEWVLTGFDLVLAGHTHAGQIRLPGGRALVTNCSLPPALAGGAHRVGNAWLHVSPGLGTSRFTRIRFNAPPEITLLELTPTRRP